ncbi:hypothetical protein PG985_000771 [Apiospora marii]|uniref:uncharacterized protein n=1 Tax=Apiospora marii TaxID=335849 RepID=UPI00312D67DF
MSTIVTVPAATGQEQIPQFPTWFRHRSIGAAQCVLGTGIFAISFLGVLIVERSPELCLMLTTACLTAIGSIYYVLADNRSSKLYNYWAAIALDSLLLVMWIISVALFAPEIKRRVAQFETYDTGCLVMAIFLLIAEVMGGLAVIVHAITLGVTVVAVYRHRKAGAHSAPITQTV